MSASKLILVGFGIAGGLPSSAAGVYIASLETIGSHFKHDLLGVDDSYDEEWKLLQGKLNENSSIPQFSTTGIGSAVSTENNTIKLKGWCKNIRKTNISSSEIFRTSWQQDLIDMVSWFCILTIVEKANSPLVARSNQGESMKKNIESLKSEDEQKLPDRLKTIRNKASSVPSDASSAEELMDWCEEKYGEPYNESKKDLVELVKKYCKEDKLS